MTLRAPEQATGFRRSVPGHGGREGVAALAAYAFFGTCRDLNRGPESTVAIMTAAARRPAGDESGRRRRTDRTRRPPRRTYRDVDRNPTADPIDGILTYRIDDELAAADVDVTFARVRTPVYEMLDRSGLSARVGEDAIFLEIDDAAQHFISAGGDDEGDSR